MISLLILLCLVLNVQMTHTMNGSSPRQISLRKSDPITIKSPEAQRNTSDKTHQGNNINPNTKNALIAASLALTTISAQPYNQLPTKFSLFEQELEQIRTGPRYAGLQGKRKEQS